MGQIINSKLAANKKVILKIVLDQDEISNLKGHLKNIHVFNSDLCNHSSQINTRGNNGVTKYFKIPLSIRSRKKHSGKLNYQKIETPSKIFYIYTLEKEKQENSENKNKK
ncbi:MAG TPA: hypothetical protein VJ895_01550 [Candidatus Nanoarchaeia archaeon]|nr:hypothetical protein [Candidatus Nanoarchaeia archaeon]